MIAIRFVALLLLLYCHISCEEKNTNVRKGEEKKELIVNHVSNYSQIDSLTQLVTRAISIRDTSAYNRAASIYWKEDRHTEFLYPAMIMANKYHFADAYFEVYTILAYSYLNKSIDNMDHSTKCIAFYYLLKAREQGEQRAIDECQTIFKGKEIPSSNLFLQELMGE